MAQQFRKVTLVPADATQRVDRFMAIMQAYVTLIRHNVRIQDAELDWMLWWAEHRTIYDNCVDDLLFPALRK